MKKQYVNSFSQSGEKVNDRFAVKFKKPPVAYKGKSGKWFEVRLSDKTGEMTAKYWGRDDRKTDTLYNSISKGDIVSVAGEIQEYPPRSGNLSVSIDAAKGELKRSSPGEYEIEDFVESTKKDVNGMVNEMKVMLSPVRNDNLRKLTDSFLNDEKFMREFKKSPAAMQYHQNYIGGLAEHTLNVMRICEKLCETHPELDRDLVMAGAFLHDVGKVREFEITGGIIDVSHEGMLTGHIPIGYGMVDEKVKEIAGFPGALRLKVLHMMLTHHGKLEYGSPKQPQLPEAVAVHYADECDGKVDLYLKLKREANTEDSWVWDRRINGHVYLK